MKCVKLNLQERTKMKSIKASSERPRRFCQKRMVNPEHEEDQRWSDLYNRFHCNDLGTSYLDEPDYSGTQQDRVDLFLTVQNLQFQGNVEQRRRARSSFKYKTLPDGQKHRMFVKQIVDDVNHTYVARVSELSDYVDDYTKYYSINHQSRPSSSKSSIVLFCLNNTCKENKSTQVDLKKHDITKKSKIERSKKCQKSILKPEYTSTIKNTPGDNSSEETKIAFYKNGKRKSLTISRTQSPATVQVIRVDVVCNYSCSSSLSDYNKDEKQSGCPELEQEDKENRMIPQKTSRLTKKYMLTKAMKPLDEKISGGKVTLMCKTYRLNDRSKILFDRKLKSPIAALTPRKD